MSFEQFKLHPDILQGVKDLGFTKPTPIQEQAIPPIAAGRDTIASAMTGSGKTAAFVLPILHRLLSNPPVRPGTRALFLAPTRELALQSMQHLEALSRHVPLRGVAVYGGVPMYGQNKALKEGVQIISATPGRLLDHVYQGNIDFGAIEVFVLDEADRMLDMGFLPDVEKIISFLPPKRQNIVVSATLPDAIRRIVSKICHDPVKIHIGRSTETATGITHAVYPVAADRKSDLLLRLLHDHPEMSSVIVFVRTKIGADKLYRTLNRAGIDVTVIHGDRSQDQRHHAIDAFRGGRCQVLVATDVAARGIDISDISHVINFDVPQSPEDYIHRSGRTARAGATGDAFTLVSPEEERQVQEIESVINQRIPRVTLPDFARSRPSSPVGHGGGSGRPHGRPGGSGGSGGRGGHSGRPHGGSGRGGRPHGR